MTQWPTVGLRFSIVSVQIIDRIFGDEIVAQVMELWF